MSSPYVFTNLDTWQNGASPDFFNGVRAVLGKTKEIPRWSPATLSEVSDEIVSRFFDATSPYITFVPPLTTPIEPTLTTPPSAIGKFMKYALPTEDEIGSVVLGSHTSGGGTGLRLEELVSKFNDLRQGKLGVKEKILEVARRKCDVVDNGDGNFVWLKWKHSPARP
jgi:3-hydroxyisobutyryl-CoA hydrolase